MTTRTAKGVANTKASGATLTISDVALASSAALVVALGYDDAQGHPTSVRWGNRNLRSRLSRDPAGYDIAMSIWTIGSVKNAGTKDIVATWSGAIVERAMIATQLQGVNHIDERVGNNDSSATTTPTTGLTGVLASLFDYALAFFVSEGPRIADSAISVTIDDAGEPVTATLGQRAGTNGAPPASNVTIQEAYLELTSPFSTQGDLIASDARLWVSGIITMDPLQWYQRFFSSGKCTSCGSILWCTDQKSSVVCSCGAGSRLNPDGTGINITAPTDEEFKAAVLEAALDESGYTGPAEHDHIVLVDE